MNRNPSKLTLIALSVSLFTPFTSFAKDSTNQDGFEVIEVMAQKRKQNLQRVGISLTALPKVNLTELDIIDTVSITQQVPSLQLNAWSPNLTIFNLRGVSQNSFTDNLEAPIAVYSDDIYLASMNGIAGQLFDMQQVEVLRGPQGTLFGRNATGGLIHYLSHLADEDHANGYIKLSVGSKNKQRLETAFGNELTEGLRARLALVRSKKDGYIKSALETGRAIGGDNNLSARIALQWDVSNHAQFDIIYKYSKDDDIPTGGYSFLPWGQNEIDQGYIPPELMNFTQDVILAGNEPPNGLSLLQFTQNVFFNPDDGFTPVNQAGITIYRGDHPNPHQHYSNIDGYLNRDMNSLQAKLNWHLNPNLSFESITHVGKLDKSYLEDGDGIPAPIIAFQTDMEYHQWSQEFRLANNHDDIKWQVGAYLLKTEHDGLATTIGNPVIRLANSLIESGELDPNYDPGANSPQAIQDYLLDSRNTSLFAQAEWSLSDEFTAIAGLRYSDDKRKLHYLRGFEDLTAGVDRIEQDSVAPSHNDGVINFDDIAAKLQLNWQLSPQHLVFTSYNRGIKAGNWAFSAGVPISDMKHQPETLHAYEIGSKSQFTDAGVSLNTTAFYYDYQDYQAFAMLGLAPHIRNTDATIKGAEFEFTYLPTKQLKLALGGSYLDTQVDMIHAVEIWNSPVGGTVIDFPVDHLQNLKMPNAPRWSFNYILRYELAILSGSLSAQFDGAYYDQQFLEVTNGGGAYQGAYHLSNFRLGYQPDDKNWQLHLSVTNLSDEIYKQYSLDLGMLGATVYYGPPKATSLNFSYQF